MAFNTVSENSTAYMAQYGSFLTNSDAAESPSRAIQYGPIKSNDCILKTVMIPTGAQKSTDAIKIGSRNKIRIFCEGLTPGTRTVAG